jgi:predicted dehydrogenase
VSSSSAPLRLGVIGAGGIAQGVHLPALRCLRDLSTVVAVCDVVEDRARKAAAAFGIPAVYALYPEMLQRETLDAVFVLTEPDRLFRPAIECLAAGKHVFMEKPPGVTTFQTESLLRAARQAGRILQVGFNRRFIPVVQHVVAFMREHTPINQVEGRFIKHGGAAFYGGSASAFEADTIHAIDLVRWIAGGTPTSAALVENRYDDEVANSWNAVVRFDNQVTGIVKANYATGARVHTLEIHGPGASAFVNLGFGDASCGAEILVFGGKGTYSIASAGPGQQSRISLDGKQIAGSDEFYNYYGFLAEDREFLECVRTGRRPLTDIEEGVRTMQFIDLMRAHRI